MHIILFTKKKKFIFLKGVRFRKYLRNVNWLESYNQIELQSRLLIKNGIIIICFIQISNKIQHTFKHFCVQATFLNGT